MIVPGFLAALSLVGLIALIHLGMRAGDRPGDALLLDVAPRITPRGARITVTNPGGAPIICGMSLRQPRARLHLEGGSYVRIRTGRTDSDLLPDRQAQIGALAGGETRTFVVPAGARLGRGAELVVVIGQSDRLRTIHRRLMVPRADRRPASPRLGGERCRERGNGYRAEPGGTRA